MKKRDEGSDQRRDSRRPPSDRTRASRSRSTSRSKTPDSSDNELRSMPPLGMLPSHMRWRPLTPTPSRRVPGTNPFNALSTARRPLGPSPLGPPPPPSGPPPPPPGTPQVVRTDAPPPVVQNRRQEAQNQKPVDDLTDDFDVVGLHRQRQALAEDPTTQLHFNSPESSYQFQPIQGLPPDAAGGPIVGASDAETSDEEMTGIQMMEPGSGRLTSVLQSDQQPQRPEDASRGTLAFHPLHLLY